MVKMLNYSPTVVHVIVAGLGLRPGGPESQSMLLTTEFTACK